MCCSRYCHRGAITSMMLMTYVVLRDAKRMQAIWRWTAECGYYKFSLAQLLMSEDIFK